MIDVIIMLAHIATAAGVLLVWQQVKVAREETELSRKAMADDHERSRRQFAIEIAREWNRGVAPETSAARQLIENLTPEQCQRIANHETVEIPENLRHLVEACLGPEASSVNKDGMISLDAAHVKQVRYFGVHYLNELEIALSAWERRVGDREYLEAEFGSVNNIMTLLPFREALNGAFPAIEAFLAREVAPPQNPLGT